MKDKNVEKTFFCWEADVANTRSIITRYSDWIFSFPPIACGLQTPYMERVQNHLKNEGAFHDNQCPRCPERFASRDEFVNHLETSNHIGMRTMYVNFRTVIDFE